MNNYSWPLNVSNFDILDKLQLALFFLRNNRWTQGNQVDFFEREMAALVKAKYAVFVSSGSTANTLMAMYMADSLPEEKKTVILPSTTWTTSCSPWIREGFKPVFLDIQLKNLGLDLNKLEMFLMRKGKTVGVVFITTLLGIGTGIGRLRRLGEKYNVKIMLDNCESNFLASDFFNTFTCSTSTYFGHMLNSVEGGFVFTDSEEEYEYFLMARNHGMVRSLSSERQIKYSNENVNSKFDFALLGNNFRNSDINAYIGRIDIKKQSKYFFSRFNKSKMFYNLLGDKFVNYFIEACLYDSCLFSLPVIPIENYFTKSAKDQIVRNLEGNGIETRPIISGNLLKQTAYKKYKGNKKYPVSDYVDEYGFYIGLHNKISQNQLKKAVKIIKEYV